MRLLVTFNNQGSAPGFFVAVVETDTGQLQWAELPEGFQTGAVGIEHFDGGSFVASQSGGVVRFDETLQPQALLPTPGASGLHSLLFRAEETALYVVSAGDDSVYRYQLDSSLLEVLAADRVYCADPAGPRGDNYHVNSIVEFDGEIHVSMFGPAPSRGPHAKRSNGAVVRISDGKSIVDTLLHPHTLSVLDGELFVIESRARQLTRLIGRDQRSWPIHGGYPRGLAVAPDGTLWIAISARRKHSASSGVRVETPGTEAIDFRCRLVELDLEMGETERSVDLTQVASEIYDLMPVPDSVPFDPAPDLGVHDMLTATREAFTELYNDHRRLEQTYERTADRRLERLVAGGLPGLRDRIRRRPDKPNGR